MSLTFWRYLFENFGRLFSDFLKHWYLNVFAFLYESWWKTIRSLDRFFALAITFKYYFYPLYSDYTFVGRFMGFFWRTIRLLAGSIVYLFISLVYVSLYLLWSMILPYLIFRCFYPYYG